MAEVITENIPQCLKEAAQWVCWRHELQNGKPTKKPHDVKTGRLASSTNPATWASFEQAVRAYQTSGHDGIGFVFTDGDPYAGIDLDNCIDDDGILLDWAREVVDEFATYTEISPSGRGAKLFFQGRKPAFAQCGVKGLPPDGAGEMEIYDRARYFTVTGDLLPGSPTEVADCQDDLDGLCAGLWPQEPEPGLPGRAPADDRVADCLRAMLAMNLKDNFDGSFRLFSACCRCVEHDLTNDQAVACVRAYAAQRPLWDRSSTATIRQVNNVDLADQPRAD